MVDSKRVQVFHHATGTEITRPDFESSTFEDPANPAVFGAPAGGPFTVQSGNTAARPVLGVGDVARLYFDTDLGALLTWNGAGWNEAIENIAGVTTIRATQTAYVNSTPMKDREDELYVSARTPSNAALDLLSFATGAAHVYVVKGFIAAMSADQAEYAYWDVDALVVNTGSPLVITAAPVTAKGNNTGTPTLALTAVAVIGGHIKVTATGVAAVPMRWTGRLLVASVFDTTP